MSTTTPEKPKQNRQQLAKKQQFNNLRSLLERGKGQLQLAMAKHMDPDRMIRLALTAATRNPKLLECSQESIGLSLLTASQLGIEPNGRDGHLVPYGTECQFIPDYKGLIKLAYRNPRVQSFQAMAVRENDEFEYEFGTAAFIKHKPASGNRGELAAAYAICKLKDADAQFVVMDREAVLKRRAVAKTTKIWEAWPDEMWAKTAVKSLSKFVPLGGEFEAAVEHDHSVEIIEPLSVEFSPPDDSKSASDKLADRLGGPEPSTAVPDTNVYEGPQTVPEQPQAAGQNEPAEDGEQSAVERLRALYAAAETEAEIKAANKQTLAAHDIKAISPQDYAALMELAKGRRKTLKAKGGKNGGN